jgi:Endonuclease/Exonuclease/phosphatase family
VARPLARRRATSDNAVDQILQGASTQMRIIAWNCNMALHKKYERLLALRPDIVVIPECANFDVIAKAAPGFTPSSSVWIGHNRHKGLGVFTFGDFTGKQSPIYQESFPFIVPIRIEGPTEFNLLAVWAHHRMPNGYDEAGLGPVRRALRAYQQFIKESPTVIAGDFNDNVRWDRPTKRNNHGADVSELTDLGLRSAYHYARVS